ncbi:MAG TPA: type II toxin-antitoxin system RelE/ParE family toxin [bacterium]|nr:type II toxin-antitoxin system RelE/ParE family toxin [bacterium]HPN44600.1 type II toxin-antitoxin system RelE/ParE family toxin [bacterium]
MKIVWSALALSRMNEIMDYISLDKPDAARKWAENLFEKIENLQLFPKSGRVVPELKRADIRELIYGNYRIIYKIQLESTVILTIRHGKQKLQDQDIDE